MVKKKTPLILSAAHITRQIYIIRGQKVMLDSDLAKLYGVPTKRLNFAVQRNKERFPDDFMLQLTEEESKNLRSQIVTSNEVLRFQTGTSKRGGRRYLPYAFTEHGIAMLSSVLRSPQAVQVNILVIRAFVQLRELLASNKDLAVRIEKLERGHKRHGSILELLIEEIKALQQPPPLPPKRRIGYIIRE